MIFFEDKHRAIYIEDKHRGLGDLHRGDTSQFTLRTNMGLDRVTFRTNFERFTLRTNIAIYFEDKHRGIGDLNRGLTSSDLD